MVPSAVFVMAVALHNKLPLSSKFSRNLGSMPKTYTNVLLTLGKYMTRFLVKSFGEYCGRTVLTDASFWPSSNCISAQKIVSVST